MYVAALLGGGFDHSPYFDLHCKKISLVSLYPLQTQPPSKVCQLGELTLCPGAGAPRDYTDSHDVKACKGV